MYRGITKTFAIYTHYNKLIRFIPVSDVFQVLGNKIGHRFGKVFEFGCLHVDLW